MPLMLSVSELKPGMCLARSIVQNFTVLLCQDHRLSQSDIRNLSCLYPRARVYVRHPALDEAVEFEPPRGEEQIAQEVSDPLRRNLESVSRTVRQIRQPQGSRDMQLVTDLEHIVEEMLRYIQENPVMINVLEQSANCHTYLVQHGINVLNYTLLLSFGLEEFAQRMKERRPEIRGNPHYQKLTPLALASLFHDIGMTPIQYLYDKTEPLTLDELQAIRVHPRVSVELLPEEIQEPARQAILHHHENFDGSGYMQGLRGEAISVFGRMLRITDAYMAAVTNKGYRRSKSAPATLQEMIFGRYRHCYDPALLHLFSGVLPPLPVGAKLRFSNGQYGVVVRNHPCNCFNPEIVMAFNERNEPLLPQELSPPFLIQDRKDIQVVSFGGTDLALLNCRHGEVLHEQDMKRLERICCEIFGLATLQNSLKT